MRSRCRKFGRVHVAVGHARVCGTTLQVVSRRGPQLYPFPSFHCIALLGHSHVLPHPSSAQHRQMHGIYDRFRCTAYMAPTTFTTINGLFILLYTTVAAFSFYSTTTCHLLLPGHLGTATWLHRLLTFIILGLTTGITLRGGISFIARGNFNYVLMTYTVLIYACMYTKTPIAFFLLRLKNPDTKTPHTCLSQPHGGYCLQ
jgi:hypothetical protein